MAPRPTTKPQGERAASIEHIAQAITLAIKERRRFTTGERELELPRSAIGIARYLGLKLDDWQERALTTEAHDILLVVTRQGGKGEVATLLALAGILNNRNYTVVVVSRSDRQAKRLLRRIKARYRQLAYTTEPIQDSQIAFELENGSQVLAVPGSEETIRGIEAVDLLIIDEAALVPDDLYHAVQPMTATTNGRTIAMTTARGKRGWFYREWIEGGPEWHRERITWESIPRFHPDWIARVRRRLGEFMFRQEFGCEFLDDVTQMYATELVRAAIAPATQGLGLKRLQDAS